MQAWWADAQGCARRPGGRQVRHRHAYRDERHACAGQALRRALHGFRVCLQGAGRAGAGQHDWHICVFGGAHNNRVAPPPVACRPCRTAPQGPGPAAGPLASARARDAMVVSPRTCASRRFWASKDVASGGRENWRLAWEFATNRRCLPPDVGRHHANRSGLPAIRPAGTPLFLTSMQNMDFSNTPPAQWSAGQLEAWLCSVGLPQQVAHAFVKAEGEPEEPTAACILWGWLGTGHRRSVFTALPPQWWAPTCPP